MSLWALQREDSASDSAASQKGSIGVVTRVMHMHEWSLRVYDWRVARTVGAAAVYQKTLECSVAESLENAPGFVLVGVRHPSELS